MKSLTKLIEELDTTILDMEESTVTIGNDEHNLDKLKKISRNLKTNVTGHGTGSD
jgi:hypothetical protein